MNLATLQSIVAQYAKASFSSFHRFLITMAAIVGLFFSFAWFKQIGIGIWEGQSDSVLNFGLFALAGVALWRDREKLKAVSAEETDQMLGHCIAVSGILAFPFVRSSVSLQAVLFAGILVGLALSQWGLPFFQRYWGATLMTLVAIYPNLQFIAIRIFRMFTPELALERLMAFLGQYGLMAMGQSAVAQGPYLSLPAGAVEVAPGCNGFAMAFTLAGCSLLIGLFFKLSIRHTALLLLIGIAIALFFNIPRIMLLANASVYWGEDSFEFWHGAWGGQIFASVMFTAYYYAVMAVLDHESVAGESPLQATAESEGLPVGASVNSDANDLGSKHYK